MNKLELIKIAPAWAERIAKLSEEQYHALYQEMEMDISSYSYCVVGEAYGYNGNYADPTLKGWYCEDCLNFAGDLAEIFHHEEISDGFIDLANKFTAHFEANHKGVLEELTQ